MTSFKPVQIFFYLAVMLFVAKPFVGFSLLLSDTQPITANSILVKSFSKRKPEDLRDAESKKAVIHKLLSNPPAILLLSIAALLVLLFTSLFKSIHIGFGFLNDLKAALIPIHPNLLTGKLTV